MPMALLCTCSIWKMGKEAKAKVRNTKGELELAVVLKRMDNIIRVHVEVAKKPWGILLRNIDKIAVQSKLQTETTPEGIKIVNCHEQGK